MRMMLTDISYPEPPKKKHTKTLKNIFLFPMFISCYLRIESNEEERKKTETTHTHEYHVYK